MSGIKIFQTSYLEVEHGVGGARQFRQVVGLVAHLRVVIVE